MDRAERDDLLLSGIIQPSARREQYEYIGELKSFHSFVDWGKTYTPPPENQRRFLPGSFIFELKGRRIHERMETEGGCACRLKLYEREQGIRELAEALS